MGNNYFNYKSDQSSQDIGDKASPPFLTPESNVEKQEFKQYEEKPNDGFKPETKQGFTSIIIPAFFNSYPVFHQTGHCIGAIREHTDYLKTPYEIILVVNGDTGIKVSNLQDYKVDKVIENKENLGFSKAVNQGIRCASGEYIAIINNDTLQFNYWLEDMQDALKHLSLIMATPMYGKPFARAVEAEQLRNETSPDIGEGPCRPIETTFSDFRDFSCFLTKKEMFNKIGLFNEEFFLYSEDLDLLRRMDKAGLKYASTKRVNTFHVIGMTSSGIDKIPEIMNESKEKLKKIWGK